MSFNITQGDTSPAFLSQLSDGSEPIDLTGVQGLRFIVQNRYEEVVINEGLSGSVNIVDRKNGEVEYIFSEEDTDTVGSYTAEWEVTFGSGAVETFPTGSKIEINVVENIA